MVMFNEMHMHPEKKFFKKKIIYIHIKRNKNNKKTEFAVEARATKEDLKQQQKKVDSKSI